MISALKFAVVGFVAGVAAALVLTSMGSGRPLPPGEMHLFWPTAMLGVEFTDWADGNLWHLLRLFAVYLGNGAVYAVVGFGVGGFVELLREADAALRHGRRGRPRRVVARPSRESRLLR